MISRFLKVDVVLEDLIALDNIQWYNNCLSIRGNNNVGVYLFIYKQLRRMQEMVAQMQAQMAAQQKGGMPNGGGPHAV